MGAVGCKTLNTGEARSEEKPLKVLLLGPGESGKSTVLKQVRILHGTGFTQNERISYIPLVRAHVFECIVALHDAMRSLQILYENYENELRVITIVQCTEGLLHSLTSLEEAAHSIEHVWKDIGVQNCYARRNEYSINDNTEYFVREARRIFHQLFEPTDQDILNCRVQTAGIVDYCIQYRSTTLRLIDVGGQKTERRKWIHCFEDVSAILFIVAISEFDLLTREQPSKKTDSMESLRKIFPDFAELDTIRKTDRTNELSGITVDSDIVNTFGTEHYIRLFTTSELVGTV